MPEPHSASYAPESRKAALATAALLAAAVHGGVLFGIRSPSGPQPVRAAQMEIALVGPAAAAVAPTESPIQSSAPPAASPVPPEPRPHAPATTPRKVKRETASPEPALQKTSPEPAAEPPSAAAGAPALGAPGGASAATSSAPHIATSARPRYKTNPEPPYPAVARRRRQEGVVLLSVLVDATGRPEAVEIRTSSGFAALDEVAVEAVQKWEFEPGRLDGAPVQSRVEVPIRFQLDRD